MTMRDNFATIRAPAARTSKYARAFPAREKRAKSVEGRVPAAPFLLQTTKRLNAGAETTIRAKMFFSFDTAYSYLSETS